MKEELVKINSVVACFSTLILVPFVAEKKKKSFHSAQAF